MATFDEYGREVPDPVPVSVPAGWNRPLSLQEEIKRFVRVELSRRAADEGEETFEESDDFEVDEDPEPVSPYEVLDLAPEWPGGVKDADGDPPPDPAKAVEKAPE